MKERKKHGFTLIEMTIVVVIISILVSIALPRYFIAVEQSRAAESASILKAIYEAQQRYLLANNEWADVPTNLDITVNMTSLYFNFAINTAAVPPPTNTIDQILVTATRNSVNRGTIAVYNVRINESGEIYSDNPQIPVGVKYVN